MNGMLLEKGKCTFLSRGQWKPRKPGFHHSHIMLSEYLSNRKICIVNTVTHYLEITKDLQITDQLIIS